MRPVDKGDAPYIKISKYQEAEPYLEKRIGAYCSFCEMRVNNALAVEHKESRNSGGALTDWSNLLLSCVYCNSRKSEKIRKGNLGRWLWPDQHNTFLAFTYEDALPKVNETYLKTVGEDVLMRAKATMEDLVLDYKPKSTDGKKYKDKRWQHRFHVLTIAEDYKNSWIKNRGLEYEEQQLRNIRYTAEQSGFFSVWMMVFQDEPKVKEALLDAFTGTSKECFDEKGYAVRSKDSIL